MKLSNFKLFLLLATAASFMQNPLLAFGSDHKNVEFLNSNNNSTLPFSEAVRVGQTLYLSGQIGTDPTTTKLVKGGIKAESKQTLENIKQALNNHGYTMSDVVKCTVMLADISQWQTFNEIYITYFSKPFPARSAFAAKGLALGSKVEVECIAASDKASK